MKIGLLGAGNIGKTLARKLASAGHEVKVANSRGPDTIPADLLETGAQAVTAEDALSDVDVVILSMPYTGFEKIRERIARLPEQTVVIDTSNYFPNRDGVNPEIEAGKVESVWVQDYFGRPIAKAWNAIFTASFEELGQPKGHPDRIAIPIAADRSQDREVALALMDDTGFDGFDAGLLAESWRQQPGSPVYCTDLSYDQVGPALAAAERDRLPKRRELASAVFAERADQWDAQTVVRISRALFM